MAKPTESGDFRPERGVWLESLAISLGYSTLTALGRRVGASRQTVRGWFNGNRIGNTGHQRRICQVLGITETRLQNGPWPVLTPVNTTQGLTPQDMVLSPEGCTVGLAIQRAVRSMLAQDEIDKTTERRERIADWLLRTAEEFSRFGADVGDLIAAARALRQPVVPPHETVPRLGPQLEP